MKVLFVNLVYGVGSTGKSSRTLRTCSEKAAVMYVYYMVPVRTPPMRTPGKSPEAGVLRTQCVVTAYRPRGLYSRTATKKLIHEVKSFRPDLIHLHTLHGFLYEL